MRCQWCANPESNNAQPELLYYPGKCIGCKKCIDKCQYGAISEIDGNIIYDRSRCKGCLNCTEVCSARARKVSGKLMTVEEVLKEVEKDMVFYRSSGGGITFSGGEPLLWPDFIKELSSEIKKHGVNTVVDTCGYYPIENFLKIKDVIDLVLFDIKFINEVKHIKYCAESNKQILSNFSTAIANIPVVVRIPIIPKINDTLEDLNAIIVYLLPHKNNLKEINILPYHNLGISKFDALCRPYFLQGITPPSKEHMEDIKAMFERNGYKTRIGG